MRRRARHTLVPALVLSAVLHVLGLATLRAPNGAAVVSDPPPIEVALLRADDLDPAERQLVAPPEKINDQPPDRPHFESDRDNTVLEESVRPGVPQPAPAAPPRQHAQSAARPKTDGDGGARRAQTRRAPDLADLFASTDELVRAQASEQPARESHEKAAEQPDPGSRSLALAVAPVAPEWMLPGTRGTLDHLPDIQRGDVTLLNTKANVFSPFVRRIGERVFQHLIIRQRSLVLQQILSARGPVRMHVLLDPKGRLSSVVLEGHSGSASMDETLWDALNTAAFDNNPPPSAANPDGNYEFVFQAQLRAFTPGEGGIPSRIESRLSVGLL